jgi:hypothetical protein
MINDPVWLIGSLGLDLHKLSAWRTVFDGGLFVEPHMPELAEFKKYFIDSLQVCWRQHPPSFSFSDKEPKRD